jgi:hypothetical protein
MLLTFSCVCSNFSQHRQSPTWGPCLPQLSRTKQQILRHPLEGGHVINEPLQPQELLDEAMV